MKTVIVGAVALLIGVAVGQHTAAVEKSGQSSKTLLEHVVSGHLTDLNGKYKLRVSEVVYKPGGHIGVHHHAGPGIRMVTEGVLTYIQGPKTFIYKTGDCFYESGDIVHTAYNKGKKPVKLINFELLPVDWKGGSAIAPPKE